MKASSLNIILFIISLIGLGSCTKDSVESKYVELKAFNKINFDNPFDIFLTEDSCYNLEIIADEDFLKNIEFSVVDSVLTIKNTSSFEWLRPTDNKVKLYIHSKPLKEVNLNETCNLQTINPITSNDFGIILKSKTNMATLDLNCNNFYYWNNFPCGGKLVLRGQTNNLSIWNYAILTVDAKELAAKHALVENNSQGNCTVSVSESFRYSITNSGNIYLYGNPSIKQDSLNSSGRLIIYP